MADDGKDAMGRPFVPEEWQMNCITVFDGLRGALSKVNSGIAMMDPDKILDGLRDVDSASRVMRDLSMSWKAERVLTDHSREYRKP